MKCLLPYFFLLTLFSFSCKGQRDKKEPADSVFSKLIPEKPLGYTSDFENVFSVSQISFLDSIIQVHEKETTNQLAVVTLGLDSATIKSGADFDRFSLLLFRTWGVGQKEKNNGIGILICPKLRKIRIETGYGLNDKLTDSEAKKIIDAIIIPEFKKGDYFTGITNGLLAIFEEIK